MFGPQNLLYKVLWPSLKEARENLNKTTIYAPVSGTISKLSVERGERVVGTSQMAGTELLRIANLNTMEVRVNVNENDIVRVKLGDSAMVEVDSYANQDDKFRGVVTQIANTAKDAVTLEAVTEFEVRIRLLNESYKELAQSKKRNSFPAGYDRFGRYYNRSETQYSNRAAGCRNHPHRRFLEGKRKETNTGKPDR